MLRTIDWKTNGSALGAAGLLPFVGAMGWAAVQPGDPWALRVFLAYGAIILSFLGGIHWGRAVSGALPPAAFGISVLPSLAAWVFLLVGGMIGLVGMALGFTGWWLTERRGLAPPWFAVLRRRLTLAVVGLHTVMGWLWWHAIH